VKREIGSGEHPADGYEIHADVLALPGVVCRMDAPALRRRGVHGVAGQPHPRAPKLGAGRRTMAEWVRVLEPGAEVDIGVPDARCRAASWLAGEIDTAEANYWILGGHASARRPAHQGVDGRGLPRWIFNAHHTLFDPSSLAALLAGCGLVDVRVGPEDVCDMRAHARTAP
jgi:hypothetical protein